jgi:PhzF family phenazine biosynthesis protein
MPTPFLLVDVFTAAVGGGNPAAVVRPLQPLPADACAAIARELNQPATAFVVAGSPPSLRWFSPKAELTLCGHGTLAAAFAVLQDAPRAQEVTFASPAGRLAVARRGDWLELELAAVPPVPSEPLPELPAILGAAPVSVWRAGQDLLVELADAATVRRLQPDVPAIARLDARTLVVTAAGDLGFDFVSRVFAPRFLPGEDMATGSVHAALGPYWGKQLGRSSFRACQASPRGGEMTVAIAGDRVRIGGRVVLVATGDLA